MSIITSMFQSIWNLLLVLEFAGLIYIIYCVHYEHKRRKQYYDQIEDIINIMKEEMKKDCFGVIKELEESTEDDEEADEITNK